jgi:hypothetical protein
MPVTVNAAVVFSIVIAEPRLLGDVIDHGPIT